MVSVARIELALQRPKRRVIPFHYTEKNLVLTEGNDPSSFGYQPNALPLSYASKNLVLPVGIEPTSTALQTAAMTTSAKAA